MEVVNTLDIDGTQWEIQDEVARNRIAELETKTTIKITEKINEEKIKLNLIEICNEKFLQLHITGLEWSGTIGESISNFVQDFGLQTVVRCIVGIDSLNGDGRYTAGLDINDYGTIKIYPHIEGSTTGTFKPCKIYGDAFIKI